MLPSNHNSSHDSLSGFCLQIAFQHLFLITDCSWLGGVYSLLGKKMDGWPSPKNGGEWSYIQLAAGLSWCSPGLSIGPSPVKRLYHLPGLGDQMYPQSV